MIDLYWANGGSYCRVFGVKDSWIPNSDNKLSFDKINVMKEYKRGNIMIELAVANIGRNQFCWLDFLFWHDSFIRHHKKLSPPRDYVGSIVKYTSNGIGYKRILRTGVCARR